VDGEGGLSQELTTFLYKDDDKWEIKVKKSLTEKNFFFDCLSIFMWNYTRITQGF